MNIEARIPLLAIDDEESLNVPGYDAKRDMLVVQSDGFFLDRVKVRFTHGEVKGCFSVLLRDLERAVLAAKA